VMTSASTKCACDVVEIGLIHAVAASVPRSPCFR
jgi:hypothetical protein